FIKVSPNSILASIPRIAKFIFANLYVVGLLSCPKMEILPFRCSCISINRSLCTNIPPLPQQPSYTRFSGSGRAYQPRFLQCFVVYKIVRLFCLRHLRTVLRNTQTQSPTRPCLFRFHLCST